MCGIAGAYQQVDGRVGTETMGRCLDHRGPDEEGSFSYTDDRVDVHFAHRRLSIIDLQHGQQPLVEAAIRPLLQRRALQLPGDQSRTGRRAAPASRRPRTQRSFSRRGGAGDPQCLRRFRGMFAFALLDQSTGSLFLARDHFGIKPLHYIRRKDGVVFASELKALVSTFGSELRMIPKALVASMLYYWVPDQMCSVQGVEKLQPGTWAEFRPDGTSRVECYWDIVEEAAAAQESHYDLREVIEESVRAHLVADVPVSSFLSGGLDSSIVTVLAKRANPEIDAYTITFRAQDHRLEAMPDDAVYARKIAQRHGIDLHEIEIQPDVVELLPRMVDILDEPIGDPAAINTLLMSRSGARRRRQGSPVGDGRGRAVRGLPQTRGMCAGRALPRASGLRPPLGQRRREAAARDRGGSWPSLRPLGQAVRDVCRTSRGGGLSQELQPVRLRPSWRRSSAPSCSRDVDEVVRPAPAGLRGQSACRTRSIACAWPTPECFFPASTSPTPTGPAWPPRPRCACRSSIPRCFGPPSRSSGKDKVSGKSGKVALKRAAEAWLAEGDRPPTQGVLLGSAPIVGDSRSTRSHRRLVARG